MKIYLFLLTALFCACSGSGTLKYESEITSVVDDFAGRYFNLDYPASVKYCTSESSRLLKFYASNVGEKEIEILRNQSEPASCEVEDVVMINDTSALAKCRVSGFLDISDIEQPKVISSDVIFEVPVVCRQGRWLVKMESPLQSEKQSRD